MKKVALYAVRVLYYVLRISPWAQITDKYQSEGSFFFECRYFVPSKDHSSLWESIKYGEHKKVIILVEPREFARFEIKDVYLINPQKIFVLEEK